MMKRLHYISVLLILLITSCENPFIEIVENPNDAQMKLTQMNFVYNNVQLEFNNAFIHFHNISDGLVRMAELGAFTYEEAMAPEISNSLWETVYADFLPDVEQIIHLGKMQDYDFYVGTTLILKSYILTTLVDFYKNVPYTEALSGIHAIDPGNENGAFLYKAAEQYLDEAIVFLLRNLGPRPVLVLYYGGDQIK